MNNLIIWFLMIMFWFSYHDAKYKRIKSEYMIALGIVLLTIDLYQCSKDVTNYMNYISVIAVLVLSLGSYLLYKGTRSQIGFMDIIIVSFSFLILPWRIVLTGLVLALLVLSLIGIVGILLGLWNKKKQLPFIPLFHSSLVIVMITLN